MNKWYSQYGEQGDIILNSSVCIQRNIQGYPFPAGLSDSKKFELDSNILTVLKAYSPELNLIDIMKASRYEAVSMAERRIVSPGFAFPAPGKLCLFSDDEDISIMLMEDDHIVINGISAGYAVNGAYEKANAIDSFLEKNMNFAFDERLGYLVQNPACIGTALRVSVLMHLPALTQNWEITRLAATVAKLGFSLNGSFGEGLNARGDMYMFSNLITLGINEREAMDNLKSFALQIATRERLAREELLKKREFVDKIQRAYGVLNTAKAITADEMMPLMSLVRLGSTMDMIPVRTETVNELLTVLQPATLNLQYDVNMDSVARDSWRAAVIRMCFARDSKVLK